MRMIEPIQIRLIHIAKAQLGLSDDEYQQAIGGQTHAKKWTSKDLTYAEADALINYFKTLGFHIVRKYRTPDRGQFKRRRRGVPLPGNVLQMMSFEQARMIETLAGKIAWKFDDGYQRWLRKYHKVDHVRTAEKAEMVIESLKKMIANQPGNDGCRKTG